MTPRQYAAQEFGCDPRNLDTFGPSRGMVYDDGTADYAETFVYRPTGDAVTIRTYADGSICVDAVRPAAYKPRPALV